MAVRRPPSRIPLRASWIALATVFLAAFPVGAAVVVTDAPLFVVSIDAGDSVSIDCAGGFVRVTDDGTPTVFTTPCSSMTSLNINATGSFDNTIDLSGMTAAAFSSLTQVLIFGGAGNDTLIGSELGEAFRGGLGDDTILAGDGPDAIIWKTTALLFEDAPGEGSDTIVGGGGTDTLFVDGSPRGETFTVVAEGTGFDLTRDVEGVLLDVDTVEFLNLHAQGGDDRVNTVGLPFTAQALDGGGQNVADVLTVDAQGQCLVSTAITIAIPGSAEIFHTNFEQVNVQGACLTEVPTLSGGMLILLGVSLALLGLFVLRRP